MENPFYELHEKLNQIEKLVLELKANDSTNDSQSIPNDLLNIDQAAAALLNLAKPTIYSLSSAGKIPLMKKQKKLYFSRDVLLDWVKTGRKKTVDEIKQEAEQYSIKDRYTKYK